MELKSKKEKLEQIERKKFMEFLKTIDYIIDIQNKEDKQVFSLIPNQRVLLIS